MLVFHTKSQKQKNCRLDAREWTDDWNMASSQEEEEEEEGGGGGGR